jgi:superfamily I DNA and/or RNA helicase
VAELEVLMESRKSIEEEKKLAVLREKKIVGMTITGAAINSSLIQKLGPKIILVEEAAEILEPCLISAISRSTEHLILIGDHKQLRPSVDTYKLKINCNFDVSMMERLIRFLIFFTITYFIVLSSDIRDSNKSQKVFCNVCFKLLNSKFIKCIF